MLERWRPGVAPHEEGVPRRSKGIPETDFHALHGELGDMATRFVWAQRAQHWIVATLAIGAGRKKPSARTVPYWRLLQGDFTGTHVISHAGGLLVPTLG